MTYRKAQCSIALMAAVILNAAPASAAGAPEICDRAFAYETLESGDYGTLCGCTAVTKPFMRVIQRSENFQSVLAETSDLCSPLAMLLTDPVTASSVVERSGDDLRPDNEESSYGRQARNRSSSSARPAAQDSSPQNNSSPENDKSDSGIYNGW